MKSTRWIAVASWLMAWPIFAQTAKDVPKESGSHQPERARVRFEPSPTGASAQRLIALGESGLQPEPFDLELEGLRQDIATIKSLRDQVAAESNQPLPSDAATAQEQRRELLDLLTKLATKSASPRVVPEPPLTPLPAPERPTRMATTDTKPATKVAQPRSADKIVDPFALGRTLFKAGQFRESEQAFRKVKVTDDNRVLMQYLVATCLRKQSLWNQAAKAYRIVAENKDDPALRDLAAWQLENIRWSQQTESQLENLRQLRESSASAKESPPESGTETSSQ